ncbi:NAD(P)-dependent oxidoreductase [Nonomuraea rubra]|uniref:3-hydroxyisobutyrate dehydrogenase-like beta-hydroxyacid dehydrogenase n=1 Tax=Nonomuraea rubra TaxID=46180 RepID=A0A7X0P7P1_9ACTN|nr:NAD(P)-binding domain-containing protein [Nonomuraea rubra]MBB6556827.1 3-hydroxyisobutyrate dehydrogenase-like beta-hydroxyacid dehydrogenase [Nonomuraea rubra]
MTEIKSSADQVAVIGTGAVGGAVVRRLLAGGHDVVVWNRTASRSAGLVDAGAVPAGSVREAVSSAGLILLTLTDHTAVRQVLAELDGDLSGRTIVAMSTGTGDDARRAAQRVEALGASYLDAGIQASPETIGTAAASILYSGSRTAFERHQATLGLLSTTRFVGDAPEAAAIWDLALFGLWYDAQLGLLRALDTVREAGIDVGEFAGTAVEQLAHVVDGASATASEVARADYPAGPATLPEHLTVIRHLIGLRAGQGLGDGGLPAVAARIEALIAEGRDHEGLTATTALSA